MCTIQLTSPYGSQGTRYHSAEVNRIELGTSIRKCVAGGLRIDSDDDRKSNVTVNISPVDNNFIDLNNLYRTFYKGHP